MPTKFQLFRLMRLICRQLAAGALVLLALGAAAGLGAALDAAADGGCAWGSSWMAGLREWLPPRSQDIQDGLLRSLALGVASVTFICGAVAIVVLPVLAALDLASIRRRRQHRTS